MSKLKRLAKLNRKQRRQKRREEKARCKKRAFLKEKNIEKYRSDKSKGRIVKKKQEKKWDVLKNTAPKDYRIKADKDIKVSWWRRVWRGLTGLLGR